MIINNNIPALNTYRQMGVNQSAAQKAMEKLSSGLRINRAGDDAAGLAISEKMRAQIRGLNQATRNAQDGISMIQTSEGALQEAQNILQRMRVLANQAANDTNVGVDRGEIQKEINQLSSEINRIGNTTEFNTQRLLNGDRANTAYSEVIGMNFVGGTDADTNVEGTGLDVRLLSGANALEAGDHTLDITVERNTRTDYQVDLAFGQATFTNSGSVNASFAGNEIVVDPNDIFITGADKTWTITVVDADTGELRITNDDTTGQPHSAEKTFFVGEEFSEYGLTFTITDLGDMVNGDTIAFDTVSGGAATNVGTELIGWDAAPVAAGDAAPTWTTALTVTDAAAAGDYTLTFDTGNNYVTVEKDGEIIDTVNITDAYDYHGIQFQIGNVNDLIDGSTISFTVEETFTVEATLNGGTAQTIIADWDGSSTDEVSEFTGIAGLQLDSSTGEVLAAGSYEFSVEQTVDEGGTDNSLAFQIGANQNQSMSISIEDMRSEALGVTSQTAGKAWVEISRPHESLIDAGTMKTGQELIDDGVSGDFVADKYYIEATFTATKDVTNGTNSEGTEFSLSMEDHASSAAALTVINDAIERVSAQRSQLGAFQNRLEHTINNLGASAENLQAAESRIRDVDMAEEIMEMTRANILAQASQAMLAQANMAPQSVLQLLG